MDYEKAYNDLIARINEAKEKPSLCMKDKHHYNGYVETGIRDALDYIINPETEDERIRTRLIALVEAFGQGKYKDEMLSYLEKQKEQKHAEQLDGTFTSYDMAKTFTEGQNYVIAHPEKFGLCKPAEWSDEDEKMKQRILTHLYSLIYPNSLYGEDASECISWLKSIRPQPHWKPSEDLREYKQ